MKTSPNANLYQRIAAILILLILLTATVGALGIVNARQQISTVATNLRQLEREIDAVVERSSYLESKIAQAHNPAFLRQRAAGILMPPRDNQIVWTRIPRIPATSTVPEDESPFRVSFELALLNNPSSGNE
jgi:hypothetical protein